MIIPNLIKHLHKLVSDFSQQTNALEVEFTENKKLAEWTIKYNIIKFQFVLTKKEKVLCPISTLFCRVYLGKNETFFYHIPELMEYLEPENYKCYYFPYIESEERMDACFSVLATFLKKHYERINALAKSTEMSTKIKEAKLAEIIALFTEKEPEPEMLEFALEGYETYVLLPRNAADSAYREFVCGNYEKALKFYGQMAAKGTLTNYEKRLYAFIKDLKTEYVAIPVECDTIRKVKKWSSPSGEGSSIFLAAISLEIILGLLFGAMVAVINAILSSGTLYYAGMPWYCAFIFAGIPALFGGVAVRNFIRKRVQKELYQEASQFDHLTNPKWVEILARTIFSVTLVGTLFVCFCTSFMSTRFYEEHMTYNDGEEFIPVGTTTCYYSELKNVYYSEGVYNVYGDYIDRPSYLFEFEDGTVWDSDGCTSVEAVEEHILPLIDSYYDEIKIIEARNELIE